MMSSLLFAHLLKFRYCLRYLGKRRVHTAFYQPPHALTKSMEPTVGTPFIPSTYWVTVPHLCS